MFEELSVVEILKVGLAGLVFLLAYFGFRLLAKEQKRENPRDGMLSHVCRFMWICVVLAILVGGVEVVKIIIGTGSESEIQELEKKLSAKEWELARCDTSIIDLKLEKEKLAEEQVTFKQKVELGLYYSQAVCRGCVQRRDSKKARDYLFEALEQEENLDEPQRAKIVKGLINIRERLEKEEDFELLLDWIEECILGFEKQLDLAKVYWAFAYHRTPELKRQRRAKSLEHFLTAASGFKESISDWDRKDIKTLIEILKDKDDYLAESGDSILEAIRGNDKPEIKRHLEEWLHPKKTESSFHFPGDRGKLKMLVHAAEGRTREAERGAWGIPPPSGIFATIPEPSPAALSHGGTV